MYKSDLLSGVPHGFATRKGGVSAGEFTQSMNFAFGRGDSDDTVIKNFEIFARAVGADPACGVMLGQIHSSDILCVNRESFGMGVYRKSDLCLDGYVSDTPGALLCVRVADCVPILFFDKTAGVIGAVHAGWRGSAAKIAVRCVEEMEKLGASRENITAAIGPSICRSCYTVGEDFRDECIRLLGGEMCKKFIKVGFDGVLHADLKLVNKLLLQNAGIKDENIDVSNICTSCNPDEFFSHRRHKNNRGTLCAMISLPKECGKDKIND